MHTLLINPNTREALTAELAARLGALLPAGAAPLHAATAAFGEAYIASEASYVVAAHAVLDAWQRHVRAHGPPAAVLVACFGDPGVWALREVAGVPVIGLAEAAMREAAQHGPYAVVTGGAAWQPMLQRLARALSLDGPAGLQAVHTVAANGDVLAGDPARGVASLQQAIDVLSAHIPMVRSVVLGGAALVAFAEQLHTPAGLPLIDSIAAGGRWLAGQAPLSL